ncbi:unnamed protein product [Microthlaspi erraticum]|uniref:F-box associated beta-propeller type 3 domain-containing protein n=1 Tax=Microthlaspi erraticum TaxID=1685480 RepID=A0A6D2KJW7_9BRAS|nr:unnamed protein product [Microthlaspi erraticum]
MVIDTIIQGKHFTMLYMARSSTRAHLLLTVFHNYLNEQFLQLCSQEDPSSDRLRVNVSRHPTRIDDFSPPVHGLICRKYDSNVIIGNPSTGQFLTLPRVKTRRRGVYSFLGYDPVNHVYKVLCMTVLQGHRQRRESQVVSEEHQVYTLGAGQTSWRMIECKHPHLTHPCYSKGGLCINGGLYYYAWIKNKGSLISFDLTSEEFSVIKLPEDSACLVNYTGKIALRRNHSIGKLDLLVLEDAKRQEWSEVSVLVPSWIDSVEFRFRGTLSTGELVFSQSTRAVAVTRSILSVTISRKTMPKRFWLKESEISMFLATSILIMLRVLWFCEFLS